jgi:DNA polymerase III epsilon subunit-like protein
MTLIALDVETGGFDTDKNPLLSMALIELAEDLTPTKNALSLFILPEPQLEVTEGAAKVNGYSRELWESRGAIPLRQAMTEVADWLPRDPVALAHHAAFDRRFYNCSERRTGIFTRLNMNWVCSCEKFRELDRLLNLKAVNHKLDTLAAMSGRWGPGYDRGKHEALDDALACAAGYRWLCGLEKK